MILSDFNAIQSNLFVRIQVDEYRASPTDNYHQEILLFSDRFESTSIAGETYLGLGQLVGITNTTSDIRSTGDQISISISGIPNSSIYEIVNSKIKGSPVEIYRLLIDPTQPVMLPVDPNLLIKFSGQVNNYTLQEEYDFNTRTSSNTLILICSNNSELLSNKIAGRRTNQASQQKLVS